MLYSSPYNDELSLLKAYMLITEFHSKPTLND